MTKHLTAETFDNEVFNATLPVLVDFWAPWCGPCRAVGPMVDELATELDGKAVICKVNVDEQADLASRFNVMSIPTLMVVKGGKIVFRDAGARDKDEMRSLLGL